MFWTSNSFLDTRAPGRPPTCPLSCSQASVVAPYWLVSIHTFCCNNASIILLIPVWFSCSLFLHLLQASAHIPGLVNHMKSILTVEKWTSDFTKDIRKKGNLILLEFTRWTVEITMQFQGVTIKRELVKYLHTAIHKNRDQSRKTMTNF